MAIDDHYELLTNVLYTGDVDEDDWNRVTQMIRRAVGETMQKIIYAGCLTTSDWRLAMDKTIGPGEGTIDECYCQTAGTTDISAILVNGATNYIWLITNSDSTTDGDIVPQSSLIPIAPDYGCQLGSITLNALGVATAVDNDNEEFLREYSLPLHWQRVQFDEVVTVPFGEWVDVEIDHSMYVVFVHAFCPKLSYIDPGCRAVLQMNGTTNGQFTMRVYNDGEWGWFWGGGGAYGYGYGYEYGYGDLTEVHIVGERWGI